MPVRANVWSRFTLRSLARSVTSNPAQKTSTQLRRLRWALNGFARRAAAGCVASPPPGLHARVSSRSEFFSPAGCPASVASMTRVGSLSQTTLCAESLYNEITLSIIYYILFYNSFTNRPIFRRLPRCN